MSRILKLMPIFLVAAALLVEGYVHGRWTGRWHTSQDLQRAVERLERVPMQIGDWHGETLPAMEERIAKQAGFEGYLNRRYKNQKTGAALSILVACGRPGPISVHTPDICYRGAGYEPTKPYAKDERKTSAGKAEMWQGQFAKGDPTSPFRLDVHWCWSRGDAWSAPANPRFTFAGAGALYKLYVIQESVRDEPPSSAAIDEFLGELLPQLNKSLSPKS